MKQGQQLRIIGGRWRSRKIHFPETAQLRPSPDRVRETLFNWLAPYIIDARCVDLFAGSGVLGFEAISRGAAQIVFIEKDRTVIQALHANASLLNAEAIASSLDIIEGSALIWLKQGSKKLRFDIAFVDPPYQTPLAAESFALLENQDWLNPNALIYFESNSPLEPEILPPSWQVNHAKKAGQVHYYLLQKL